MEIKKTKLEGVHFIEPKVFEDDRGSFVKMFHKNTFIEHGLDYNFQESYYSISKKDVLRGMHFQTPPQDHSKLVHVSRGSILDVVLDIRKGSPTYGDYIKIELSAKNKKSIYIPAGFAHGFLSLEDNTYVNYMQTTMHSKDNDDGIKFDSFDFTWPVENPIVSERDKTFVGLKDYLTPFVYNL